MYIPSPGGHEKGKALSSSVAKKGEELGYLASQTSLEAFCGGVQLWRQSQHDFVYSSWR